MDRLTTAKLGLILLLVAGDTAEAAIIRGVPSCAHWIQERQTGGRSSYFSAMWLVGYLSGEAVQSGKDILRNTDSESIAVWMDNYCKGNSLKNIADGGEVLFDELVRYAPSDQRSPAATAPAPATPDPPVQAPSAPAMALPGPATPDPPVQAPSAPAMALPGPATPDPPLRAPAAPAMASPAPAKASIEEPVEPSSHDRVESLVGAPIARTYLPKALTLTGTLPLGNSKFQFKAEQYAKANGCGGPAATMNIRTATSETFTLNCSNGTALSIRCDPDCRDLQ